MTEVKLQIGKEINLISEIPILDNLDNWHPNLDNEEKKIVTKQEHDKFSSETVSQSHEDYNDYRKGYQNATVEVQR